MAEFDAAAAKSAGYSDAEIAKIQKGITDARAAGHSDADIRDFLARTGGRVSADATSGQTVKPEIATDKPLSVGGTAAAFGRGAAPYAAGAAAGAAMGAPFAGIGAVPGAVAGIGATALTQFGGDIYNWLAQHTGLPQVMTPQEVTDRALDAIGVARPGNWLERGAEASGGLAASMAGVPVTPKPTPSPGMPQQLLQDFERQGVSPSVPVIGQGDKAAMAQNLGKRLPVMGGVIHRGVTQQLNETAAAATSRAASYGQAADPKVIGESIDAAIKKEVQRLGGEVTRGSSAFGQAREPFEAGSEIRNSLQRFAADTSQADRDYGDFYKKMAGSPPIAMSNTLGLLNELMGRFPNAPELTGIFTPSPIARAREALEPKTVNMPERVSPILGPEGRPAVTAPAQAVQKGGVLTLPELQELRTKVGYQLEHPAFGPDQIPRGQLKRLYAALTKDMHAAAQARGPDAVKALVRATTNYGIRAKFIDRLEPLLSGEAPERVFSKLNSAAMTGGSVDAGLLRSAKANMSPEEWGDIGATIISRLGKPRPGSRDMFINENFSPAAFAENWGKLSDQAKGLLFGGGGAGTAREAIEKLVKMSGTRDRLSKIVSVDNPERSFAALNSAAQAKGGANANLLSAAKSVMPPEEWGDFAATVVSRLGTPSPGASDILKEANFSISSYATNWNKLSDRAKDIIFGPAGPGTKRDALDSLARVVQAEKNVEKLANVSRSAEYILGAGVVGEALNAVWRAVTQGSIGELAGWGAAGGAGYVAGKLLTSSQFAKWVYQLPSGQPVTPGLVAKSAVNLINALTAPDQTSPKKAEPRRPATGTHIPNAVGITPTSPMPAASPF